MEHEMMKGENDKVIPMVIPMMIPMVIPMVICPNN